MLKKLLNLFRKPVPVVLQTIEPVQTIPVLSPTLPQTSEEIEQLVKGLRDQIENYNILLKKIKQDEFDQFVKSKPRFCAMLEHAGVDISLILHWNAAIKVEHRKYAENYRQRSKAYVSIFKDYDKLSTFELSNLKWRKELYYDYSVPDSLQPYIIADGVRYDLEEIWKQCKDIPKEHVSSKPIPQYKKWDLSNNSAYRPENEIKIGEQSRMSVAEAKAKGKFIIEFNKDKPIKSKVKSKTKSKKKIIKKKV